MDLPKPRKPGQRRQADAYHAERDLKRLRKRRPDVGASLTHAYQMMGLRPPRSPA